MNELSKHKETFKREIANLDFMKFYERNYSLAILVRFVNLCVFARCVNYVRYVSYGFASYVFAS